ncbi:MAG: hypothetical protein HC884_13775 [Chloroflexaceae bacterium]|nr:hypothetical protein [Chloroflexaceae bacterium]
MKHHNNQHQDHDQHDHQDYGQTNDQHVRPPCPQDITRWWHRPRFAAATPTHLFHWLRHRIQSLYEQVKRLGTVPHCTTRSRSGLAPATRRWSRTRRRLTLWATGGALVVALSGAPAPFRARPVYAATITVNDGGDTVIDGDGNCTLREAITNATYDDQSGSTDCAAGSGDDTITLAVATITLGGELDVDDMGHGAVTIVGRSPGSTVIDADGNGRAFSIDDATLTLERVTIQGGYAFDGGGIFNDGGDVTLSNSTVSGNEADDDGGGLYNKYGGNIRLLDSTVSDNYAYGSGGGILNEYYSGSYLLRSTVSRNGAYGSGGGIANFYGSGSHLRRSTVSGNYAYSYGGGITNYRDSFSYLLDSTVSGNTSDYGGGLSNGYESGLQLKNSTVSNNTATGSGGGIATWNQSNSLLLNSTISKNRADLNSDGSGDGGGVYCYPTSLAGASHSIIAGNRDRSPSGTIHPDVSGILLGDAHNLVGDSTGAMGDIGLGSDLVVSDPHLGPLADNGGPTLTHALLPGSPAIDAGDSALSPTPPYDQRGPGFTRVVDGDRDGNAVIDIGAYEVQPSIGGIAFFIEPGAQATEGIPLIPLLLLLAGDTTALAWLLWRTWRRQRPASN